MKLTLKSVQQLNTQQIFELLLPIINKLYEKVDYIGITKEEFYHLVLKKVEKSKKTYKGDMNYIKYIQNRINTLIENQIKNNLLETETAVMIIDNYINKYFKRSDSYEDSIKNLKDLANFFELCNYIPNLNILIQIIEKNSNLSKTIESIIKKHQTQIISGNLEEIFENNIMISIIKTYCMLYNIEIKALEMYETDNIDLDNFQLTDSVKMYLKEISKRPLLSVEEEYQLAKRISQGDDYAREIFIESNLKLVVNIAKGYIGRGLSFLDLIQEGNFGLMTAVDKFDATKGYKFSTYATYWVKQAISRAIANKGRNVRIPVHLYEKIGTYKKTITKLETILNRRPTINEIAEEMKLAIPEVIKLYKLQSDTISINTLISDDESTELENFILASEETPEDIVVEENMSFQVKKILETSNLNSKEIEVLILRFGLNNQDPMPLRKIGEKYNVSGESIRRTESRALMKIRKNKQIKSLAEYMEYPDKSLENIKNIKKGHKALNQLTLEDKKIQVKEKEKMPKLKTIYQYFYDYTKDQIDTILEKLTEEEKELITLRYGKDLNHPVLRKLTKEQAYKFYSLLIPKIKKLLSNPNNEKTPRKKEIETFTKNQKQPPKKIVGKILTTMIEEPSIESPKSTTLELEKLNKNNESQNECIAVDSTMPAVCKIQEEKKNITKEDYQKILDLLKTPTLNQMLPTLDPKELVIIYLKLGYIDNKYFSSDSIAQFLGIEKQEVINIIRKILLQYKENINHLIDKAMEIMTDQPKQLTKKLQ